MSDMKPTVSERLDNILGIEKPSTEVAVPETLGSGVLVPVESSGNPERDFNDDFEKARTVIHNVMNKGVELTDAANYIAKEKQDSRSIEAAAMAQEKAVASAIALIDLHKKKADQRQDKAKSNSGDRYQQNNAVFVGTTGELLKLTRDLNKPGFLMDALEPVKQMPSEVINVNTQECDDLNEE